jgi:glucuronosyltransferase
MLDLNLISILRILDHPKVIAFISHGGINSINEATAAAVPLICIPLFAEQLRNAIMVEYRGIGIKVEKKEIMEGRLEETIKTILDDQRYCLA